MFSPSDLAQIEEKGMTVDAVQQQLEYFQSGFPYLDIQDAATVDKGIIRLSESEVKEFVDRYESQVGDKRVLKFVPASGAASRMFKALFAFKDQYDGSESAYKAFLTDQGEKSLYTFFTRLKDFAFYEDLKQMEQDGEGLSELLLKKDFAAVLGRLLEIPGLGYGKLPKALLKFHRYGDSARTSIEEHLVEAALYGKDANGIAALHFTVSPEHQEGFEALLEEVREYYEQSFQVRYEVSYSIQKPSTDTMAVDLENEPFREEDGHILFRPGGHGALVFNLNELEADIVFIKNIDNVVPDHLKEETIRYKKALAGVLLGYQQKIFEYLALLESGEEGEHVSDIEYFLKERLCVLPPEGYEDFGWEEKLNYLYTKLNRPLRVCGMVKNEGEPGGGPFWVKNSDGTTSLQIVESAQIDKEDPDQMNLMKEATHFNPVDLVCALKDFNDNFFDLLNFRDPETGFIAQKSKNGRDLKALEHPGLWNGAMAYWNTLFVEVPIVTFNPVKTVMDLLRPQHQPEG